MENMPSWSWIIIGLILGLVGLFLWVYPFVVIFIVIKNRLWKALILLIPFACIQGIFMYQIIINEFGNDGTNFGIVGMGFSIISFAVCFFVQLYSKYKKEQEKIRNEII